MPPYVGMNCNIAPKIAHNGANATPINSRPANQMLPTISASSVAARHHPINAVPAVLIVDPFILIFDALINVHRTRHPSFHANLRSLASI
jgi:hypothetical protein